MGTSFSWPLALSQAPVFSNKSNQDLRCHGRFPCHSIQAALIFSLGYLLAAASGSYPVPACCSSQLFLCRNFVLPRYSGFVVFISFLRAVGQASNICCFIRGLDPVPIQPSLSWSQSDSFSNIYASCSCLQL